MPAAVYVKGYRETARAFAQMSGELKGGMMDELKEVGEPVRRTAETLAVATVSNIGGAWSRQKLGVTSRAVYIAPAARRRGGSPRPNLGRLLMNDAMWPAAKQNEPEIVKGLDRMLGRLAGEHGFD